MKNEREEKIMAVLTIATVLAAAERIGGAATTDTAEESAARHVESAAAILNAVERKYPKPE